MLLLLLAVDDYGGGGFIRGQLKANWCLLFFQAGHGAGPPRQYCKACRQLAKAGPS
jgi:hypothetical protein